MTSAEKVKFIRAEGWKMDARSRWFRDPLAHYGLCDLLSALRIAMQRKGARERRRLRAAGWVYARSGVPRYRWTRDMMNYYERETAIDEFLSKTQKEAK